MKRIFLALFATILAISAFSQSDPLTGKKMVVFGDSYVRNHREPVENTWHYKFAKKHGMEYSNHGRNGSCVALDRQRFGKAMYKKSENCPIRPTFS